MRDRARVQPGRGSVREGRRRRTVGRRGGRMKMRTRGPVQQTQERMVLKARASATGPHSWWSTVTEHQERDAGWDMCVQGAGMGSNVSGVALG